MRIPELPEGTIAHQLARCVVNLITFDRLSPACLKSGAPAPYTDLP
ncbi:hypothetical protein D8I24_1038 [Cupriavidus necator H850]|nr:hypothetical protein D8I24_1038 [Cupriavidus necator H850]